MIDIYFQGRGTGKTTNLIYHSARTHIPIAVTKKSTARDLTEKAKDLGVHIPTPIVISCFCDLTKQEVLIDDFDLMLSQLSHNKIKAIAISYPEHRYTQE